MELCNPSEIKELLNRHGFRFSKSMGQNFLINGSVPRRIVKMSGIDKSCGILEIGSGIGALTVWLGENAGKVVSIEVDKSLLPLLAESLAGHDNIEIVMGDVLKTDIPALVREKLSGLTPCVCANLPYNITTPVLTKLMEPGIFETMTVMIQKEVAKRITAAPGTADYGSFTVYVNYHARPEILFDVPPSCFMPQPKVTSSVIKLTRRERPEYVTDKKLFFRVVRASFAQRRKTMVNGLSSAFPLTKEELCDILRECGFDERIRGENMGIPEFAAVAEKIGERL